MKIKNAFWNNFNLKGKIKLLNSKGCVYLFKVAFSRFYTTGWLGIISLMSLGLILNDSFSILIFKAKFQFLFIFYMLLLDLAKGILVSFVFYFIVVHIEKESKKSSLYLYLNNEISYLNNYFEHLLQDFNKNKLVEIDNSTYTREKVVEIFRQVFEKKELEAKERVLKSTCLLKDNIDELLALNAVIDNTIIRRLTQIKAYSIRQLIFYIKLNVISKNAPGIDIAHYVFAIMSDLDDLLLYFRKEYSIYQFEYENDYKRNRKK